MIPVPIKRLALPPISEETQDNIAGLIRLGEAELQICYEDEIQPALRDNIHLFSTLESIRTRFGVDEEDWLYCIGLIHKAIADELRRYREFAVPFVSKQNIQNFRFGLLRERYDFCERIEALRAGIERIDDGWCYFVHHLPEMAKQGIIYATVVAWILLDAAGSEKFDLTHVAIPSHYQS